jgi:hypothetical protein
MAISGVAGSRESLPGGRCNRTVARLGEHTEAMLNAWLGPDRAGIDRLRQAKAVPSTA